MFIIGQYSRAFQRWIYICSYRRATDGVTSYIEEAHSYRTSAGAWRAAERCGPKWEVFELV